MAGLSLGTSEIEYLLSLLPNGLRNLEICLDSVKISSEFGISFAYQLNRFTLL